MTQSRDPRFHHCPDGETIGGFTVCAVGQHWNGINKKINRVRDGCRHSGDYLGHQISTAMRAAVATTGFCSKEEPREERKERDGSEQKASREERVCHLKAAMWAAEKLDTQPPSPRSHLDGAGRQESVVNNRGGRAVGRVKSDAPVAIKEKEKTKRRWKPGRKQQGLIDVSNCQRN